MSRALCRIGFIVVPNAAIVAICVLLIGPHLPKFWGVALGGGLGSLVVSFARDRFDKLWPEYESEAGK